MVALVKGNHSCCLNILVWGYADPNVGHVLAMHTSQRPAGAI